MSTATTAPDNEQEAVLYAIAAFHNCVVSANPGTGKTTTVLTAAARHPDRRFLVLTYNNSLQSDTARAIAYRGLANVEVCTYHQFVLSRYDPNVCDDWGIVNVLRRRGATLHPADFSLVDVLRDVHAVATPPFDVLVVDEVQDMSRLYFLVVVLAAVDAARSFQMVFMGDERQGVYAFRGADTRFLRRAADLWRGFPRLRLPFAWTHVTFTVTHRLSPSMCFLLNVGGTAPPPHPGAEAEVGLAKGGGDGAADEQEEEGDDDFTTAAKRFPALVSSAAAAARSSRPVSVCVDTTAQCAQFVLHCIDSVRARFACPLHDIAVLCPSLHADPCTKAVMQALALRGMPVYAQSGASAAAGANSEDTETTAAYAGCVRFYTFWSAKGLTVRFAIAINANNNHFVLRTGANPARCPSPHFVCFSRASEMLVLVYAYDPTAQKGTRKARCQLLPPYLPREVFEDETHVRLYGEMVDRAFDASWSLPPTGNARRAAAGAPRTKFSVTQLCAFLSSDFIAAELADLYDWFVLEKESGTTPPAEECAPSAARNAFGRMEDVSDINGKAMAYYGYDFLGGHLPSKAAAGSKKRKHDHLAASSISPPSSPLSSSPGCGGGGPPALDVALRQATPHLSWDERAENPRARDLLARFNRIREKTHRSDIRDYVHAVCLLEAVHSGMYHRALHFRESDMAWIPESAVQHVETVLRRRMVPCGPRFRCEEPFSVRVPTGADAPLPASVTVHGVIDVVSGAAGEGIHEWKYKSALQLEDFLQLLVYAYVKLQSGASTCEVVQLLNLRTGDAYVLRNEYKARAFEAVQALLRARLQDEDATEAEEAADEGHDGMAAFLARNRAGDLAIAPPPEPQPGDPAHEDAPMLADL